jgi:phosphate-selective porin OprO/OprP
MRKHLMLLALLGSGTIQSHAEATGLFTGNTYDGDTTYDKLWSLFTLYKDESNPILQEFSLQGRLQVQYADGDSNGHFDIEDFKNGSAANEQTVWGDKFEARRARLGFKSKWFQNWKFEGQIDADTTDGPNEFYRDIYDLYLTYAPSDALNVTVGKTKVKFGREQEISSKEILTFERSLVSNLFFPGELTGIMVNGKGLAEHVSYELGLYGSERSREFAELDQGAVILAKIGYDYATQSGLDTAVASLQYMHNTEPGYRDKDEGVYFASASPSFTDSIALTNDITHGRFGLTTDVLYGFGYSGTARQAGKTVTLNQSDVFGITLIPSYFIADGLQLVGQFQFASSTDANGLSLYGRYEKWAPVNRPTAKGKDAGNTYSSAYVGLNYYLYGHKLKLMNGVEYSHLGGGDYDGYTFLSGLRFSF